MTLWESGDPTVEGGEPAPAIDEPEAPDTWTIAELGEAIAEGLHDAFPDPIWMRGEISGLRPPNKTGHRYFDLIEPGAEPGAFPKAKVSVALFKNAKERVNATLAGAPAKAEIANGVEVRIRGRVDWWVAGGQLRVIMSDIDPTFTLGKIDEQRRLLLAKLLAEGLLERNGRLAVPLLPLRIGLVTSAGSAAHADFVKELATSGYAFEVVLADARVQGADAPRSVVAAITRVAAQQVDVIVVIRGGGAITDLAAFDHEDIARAIANAPVPVFTGIGHEIDHNVAGDVAHSDFKTPTATAADLVARVAAVEHHLAERQARLTHLVERRLTESTERLQTRTARIARAAQVAGTRAETHVNGIRDRILAAVPRHVRRTNAELDRCVESVRGLPVRHRQRATDRLDAAAARVTALDPARVLARGWSLTRTVDGRTVRDPSEVRSGDRLITTVAGGDLVSTVDADT